MKTLNLTISEAIKNGKETKINHPLMYKGFIIKNVKTNKGYKLKGYSYVNDVFINPLYNSFESIKLVIDNLK